MEVQQLQQQINPTTIVVKLSAFVNCCQQFLLLPAAVG